jgi:hypothetical protein
MNIDEVTDILNSFRLLALLAPQHIFITDEPLVEQLDGEVRFRGLSPKLKRGVMILSRDADASTVPHEWVHAALGLGERVAYPFGNLMKLRYMIRGKFPALKERPKIIRVSYRPDEVPPKYRGRIEHYVLD